MNSKTEDLNGLHLALFNILYRTVEYSRLGNDIKRRTDKKVRPLKVMVSKPLAILHGAAIRSYKDKAKVCLKFVTKNQILMTCSLFHTQSMSQLKM